MKMKIRASQIRKLVEQVINEKKRVEQLKFSDVKKNDRAIDIDGGVGKVINKGKAKDMFAKYSKENLEDFGMENDDPSIVVVYPGSSEKVVWGYGSDAGGAWVEKK